MVNNIKVSLKTQGNNAAPHQSQGQDSAKPQIIVNEVKADKNAVNVNNEQVPNNPNKEIPKPSDANETKIETKIATPDAHLTSGQVHTASVEGNVSQSFHSLFN